MVTLCYTEDKRSYLGKQENAKYAIIKAKFGRRKQIYRSSKKREQQTR